MGSSGGAEGSGGDAESLAVKLKDKLATRGARGIIGLQRQFKIMDDDNSKSLNKYEFSKAMNDFMLGFSQGQISTLFEYFDVDSNGSISYDEFLRSVRGPMNMARKKMVAQAYKKLDKDGNGWIDINDVRGVYKADKHPEVLLESERSSRLPMTTTPSPLTPKSSRRPCTTSELASSQNRSKSPSASSTEMEVARSLTTSSSDRSEVR